MAADENKQPIDCSLLTSKEGEFELQQIFQVFAQDNNKVPVDDFGSLLRTVKLAIGEEEVASLIPQVDPEGTGFIDFEQFQKVVTARVTVAEDPGQLLKAFKVMKNQKGSVTIQELRHHLVSFSSDCTEENVDEFFKGAPVKGDGNELNFELYREILCST